MSTGPVMRVLFAGLILFLLTGPSQGAVGSCSDGSDPLGGPADVQAYCDEREQLVCMRRYERGELNFAEREACRRAAVTVCQNRTFLPGCVPSEREAQACLAALHSRSTLDQTVNQIRVCRELCDASDGIPVEPDGGVQ